MQSFVTSTQGAFRSVLTAGAIALTVAGAAVATTGPAEAFVRHGGGVHHHGGFGHHGGLGHRFGGHRIAYGAGRPIGGYGLRHHVFGFRPFGYGGQRFVYRVGVPYGGYGFPRCGYARHFVPGVGCRLDRAYGYQTFGYGSRPFGYGVRRVIHPHAFRHQAFHAPGFGYGIGRPFGGYGHGFRHAGFGHGFQHGGFHHGGFGGHRGGVHHGGHGHRRH